MQLVEAKEQTDLRFTFPRKKTNKLPNAFFLLYTSHICFIDEIPSWKGALCQLNHQHFPRSFWKTIRIKYLLVKRALDNCSKGVSLCQAPWKTLLWDWRQKQPRVSSCAAIAKTRMNLPWDTPRANRNSLGEPQGKSSWVWFAALLLFLLVLDRSRTKQAVL